MHAFFTFLTLKKMLFRTTFGSGETKVGDTGYNITPKSFSVPYLFRMHSMHSLFTSYAFNVFTFVCACLYESTKYIVKLNKYFVLKVILFFCFYGILARLGYLSYYFLMPVMVNSLVKLENM